jgi:dTDP-4-dehydrorhamnose reductase
MSAAKYLIAGRNGQLAQAFIKAFEQRSLAYAAPEEKELDITDPARIEAIIGSFRPDTVINCAAYNLVDKAEDEREKAFLVNTTDRRTSHGQRKHGAWSTSALTMFSTERSRTGSTGKDAVNLNEYGRSKLAGEQAVIGESSDDNLVLRLSWVYGDGKQNFIYKLTEWTKSSEYLKIACDEFSVPTSTRTIVEVTLRALEQGASGLYHLTNSGYCSRYEWAKLVLSVLKVRKFIRPVSMDEFNLPAKRPKFSAMNNETLGRVIGVGIPEWGEAVAAFLREQGYT